MTDIRPIETSYRGYRFRSRLEARWAVFFDRCRQTFIYECEGYVLPSGPYLPDFFFPRWQAFIEVKPLSELPTKNFEFWLRDPNKWGGESCRNVRPTRDDFPREIVQACEMSRTLQLEPGHFVVVYGDPVDVMGFDGGAVCLDRHGLREGIGFIDLFPASLLDAADAARGARFEHGEGVR